MPFGRREVRPAYPTGSEIFSVALHHAEKCLIRLRDRPLEIPHENTYNVGVDQPPDLRFTIFEVAVQTGIFQRDGGLRGDELQHRDPGRRKGAGSQIVFEVERADEPGLVRQRQAENGAGAMLTDVRIRSKLGLGQASSRMMLSPVCRT